jgi:hypothetical protein
MEHYLSLVTGADKDKGQEILDLMASGDLHEAEHEIEELLGQAQEEAHEH